MHVQKCLRCSPRGTVSVVCIERWGTRVCQMCSISASRGSAACNMKPEQCYILCLGGRKKECGLLMQQSLLEAPVRRSLHAHRLQSPGRDVCAQLDHSNGWGCGWPSFRHTDGLERKLESHGALSSALLVPIPSSYRQVQRRRLRRFPWRYNLRWGGLRILSEGVHHALGLGHHAVGRGLLG